MENRYCPVSEGWLVTQSFLHENYVMAVMKPGSNQRITFSSMGTEFFALSRFLFLFFHNATQNSPHFLRDISPFAQELLSLE